MAEDAAAVEDVAVLACGFGGRGADDVSLAGVAAWAELDVAAVEVYGAASADEVDGAFDGAVLEVGGAPVVGVVCVLCAHERDVLEDVALAFLLVEGYGAVGEGVLVVAEVGPEFDVLDVGAVGSLEKEGGGAAYALVEWHGLYLGMFPSFSADARVGRGENGHGRWYLYLLAVFGDGDGGAVALDAVHARLNEDAVALALVGAVVGRMDGVDEIAVGRNDEVVFEAYAPNAVGSLGMGWQRQGEGKA